MRIGGKRNVREDLKVQDSAVIARRSLMKGAAALAGAAAASVLQPVASGAEPRAVAPAMPGFCNTIIVGSNENAIVETTAGKVRGFTRNGINTFLGIPYAGSTAGKARFDAPTKPVPWTGLRSSMQYGFVSPQEPRAGWADDEVAWMFDWDDGRPGEDCLRVNIWSPGLNDGRKRPVMVWLHGGGFSAGSGQELKSYYGENLSRRGDVVVVSLNHRLGVLGYLNLAEAGGSSYANSGNAGMLDIVAALEWVRDNIANFGGDPGNVTVFGQSGGGGKVTALMAMPRAAGLFHRAIVESGSMLRMPAPDTTAKLAGAVLKELEITKANLDRLHWLPVERIVSAGVAAAKAVFPATEPSYSKPFDFERHAELKPWAPTVDGGILPESPFVNGAPAVSAKVPLLVGSTRMEAGVGWDWPDFEDFTMSDLTGAMTKAHGKEMGARVLAAFRRAHPEAKPCDLFALWQSSGSRRAVLRQASAKAAQGGAPAYVYLFAWNTPILDGRIRSYHCAELPFVFDNTDRCDAATGGGPAARALAAKVSEAWIRFARTGNPNHDGLPEWPVFSAGNGATMVFDNTCSVAYNADREELNALAEASNDSTSRSLAKT
ncbi:MAG TPA: carboxylesterase family protein [Candidatus Baltobacteraceae bacterium]|nr:carboxylesterase family protein [Candidatus Baltobacteraceae bacterium]